MRFGNRGERQRNERKEEMGCKQVKTISFTVVIFMVALVSGQELTAITEGPENDYNTMSPTEPTKETTEALLDDVDFALAEEPKNVYNTMSPTEPIEETTEDLFNDADFGANVTDIIKTSLRELKTPSDAHRFIQSKGIEMVIEPILLHSDMTHVGPVLVICKRLFQLIPKTASTMMPYSYLEKVLDLFKENMNPKVTKHAVEVITLWLLQNPGAQTHVIKVRGLHQFYEILLYLNIDDVGKMLSLFRQLIQEHKEVRGKSARLIVDETRQNMYNRIGLLELAGSYEICVGLVKLYNQYLPELDKLIIEITDLIKITKEFCSDKYYESYEVIQTFKSILEYISDARNFDYFETIGLNVVETEIFLRKYLDELKQKTEL